MDRITISSPDRAVEIIMPRVRAVTLGGEEVATEKAMASGRLVKEVKGFRATIRAEWEWLPVETVRRLHELLRRGGYFLVEYPDPVAGVASGLFSVNYPDVGIFRFVAGEPRWYGASLTMKAQEVK